MAEFKKYRRKKIAELRPVTKQDIEIFNSKGELRFIENHDFIIVSISQADINNGSPKIGDMIARNPKNNLDQWLINKEYFEDNFEPIK